MANLKYSRQRESIKTFLASRKDHPTADTVYTNMRQQIPNISLGTVYRNLGLLADIGEIRKISVGDGVERFDYDTEPHSHFVCRECHSVIDLYEDDADSILEAARKNFPGQIDMYSGTFYGICENCIKKLGN
ncbi:MAG: Fur family transcriptional regulator [Marvinbryantia sp.]|jgi:Fur family peroxide stress response transcriptional regulator